MNELPAVPGPYLDRDDTLWLLNAAGEWAAIDYDSWSIIDYTEPEEWLPFRALVVGVRS